MQPDANELARRIKAARALAGIASTTALANRIGVQGLSGETLRKIESGSREVRPHELREIARACGLPFEFFTVDFAQLAHNSGAGPQVAREVEAVVERLLPDIEEAVTRRVLQRLRDDDDDEGPQTRPRRPKRPRS